MVYLWQICGCPLWNVPQSAPLPFPLPSPAHFKFQYTTRALELLAISSTWTVNSNLGLSASD